MKSINTKADLKEAIRLLEIEQTEKAILVKDQFHHVYENLNPIILVKNYLNDITSPQYLLTDILNNTFALASTYITKKLVVKKSASSSRKLFGSVIQFSVTTLVLKYKEQIRSITHSIIQSMFSREENEVA